MLRDAAARQRGDEDDHYNIIDVMTMIEKGSFFFPLKFLPRYTD